jgi:class 3 adenylate cyclase
MTGPEDATTSSPREERRVITVLFADLVGFTERAESLDPEDVRGLLTSYYRELRTLLEEHGGVVDKFIGDAVMAVFGAPVAHEDDPERAVRAALAIRGWARGRDDVKLRIGVNTGTALVGLEPSATGVGMVAGDMVNTASRIQSAAPTDGVLVGESTYRATTEVFDYRPHEPVEAKGKSEPLSVWEPLRARVAIGGARRLGEMPLVGRERELRRLLAAFELARDEARPRLVTLVGVPGIGKTRLAGELEQRLRGGGAPFTWLTGRSPSYGAGGSLSSLGDMVKSLAGIAESDDAATVEAKLRSAVAALPAEDSDAAWLLGQLRPLVGVGGDRPLHEDGRADAFAAWRRLFELLAHGGPVVLAFDDLHWADDAVLDFVDELVEQTRAPVLVLATARPELSDRRPGWGAGDRRETIALEPLTDEETMALVRGLAGSEPLSSGLEETLLARAAGNPLYAEEFSRMAAEGGTPGLALPESVRGIVAARLDVVPLEERDVLQDAAVLGQRFWPDALVHLGPRSREGVDDLLARLERKEFVSRAAGSGVDGEWEYGFRHPLIREVAYEQIPRARRARMHLLAAEWTASLPADRAEERAEPLAQHYVDALGYARAAGEEVGDLPERTWRALAEAGDRARALHSLGHAADRYREALELAGEHGGDTGWIALSLAEVELRTGSIERAREQLAGVIRAARHEQQAELLARAALALGGVGVRVFDADDELVALLEEALAALGDGSPALRARLLSRLSIEVYYVPPTSRREALSEEAVALARGTGNPEALLDALNARRVTLWSPDRLEERLAASRELVERADASGDRERSLLARTWLVLDLVEGGDLERARAEIDAYARLVEPLGIAAYSWWVPAWRAMLAGLAGRFDEARELADEAREIGARAGDTNAAIYAQLADWFADMEQGRDLERWVPVIREGIARGGPSDAFRCGEAMLLALAGRLEDARRALDELGPGGFGSIVKDMNFYAGAGELTVAVGLIGDARGAAEAYEVLRPYSGRTFTIARAAVCWGPADVFLGRLAATAGRFAEAETHFEAGLADCERIGARALAARARAWYAEMLRARAGRGDAERADALERTAREEAELLGLALSARRAEGPASP